MIEPNLYIKATAITQTLLKYQIFNSSLVLEKLIIL